MITERHALLLAALVTLLGVAAPAGAQPVPPEPTTEPSAPPPPPTPTTEPSSPPPIDTAPSPSAAPPTAPPSATPPPPPAPPPAKPPPSPPAAAPSAAPVPPAEASPYLRGGAPLYFLGAPNVFRTSHLGWDLLLSTKLLGGDPGQHHMVFSLVPRIALVETKAHWAWVGTDIGLRFLVAHDEKPRLKPDPPVATFDDLPIDLGYAYTFVERADGLVVRAGPRASVAFPTSPDSRDQGVYVTTRLGLGIDANVPLLHGEGLNAVFVRGVGVWSHAFSQNTDPGNFVRDRLAFQLDYWLNLWGDLALGNGWGIAQPFHDTVEQTDCVVMTQTGCVDVSKPTSSGATAYSTYFDVSLSYLVGRLVWVSLGYDNTASSISAGGSRRSLFGSQFAEVYLSASLLLDQVLRALSEALTSGRARCGPARRRGSAGDGEPQAD